MSEISVKCYFNNRICPDLYCWSFQIQLSGMSDTVVAQPPAVVPTNQSQQSSLANLPRRKKYCLYEAISEDDLSLYHQVSCKPITKIAEDDMELLSDIICWGERYRFHWESGVYACSRCSRILYSSTDKYYGPCVWPSFRKPVHSNATSTITVHPYNQYTVTVKEVYCGSCDLFIGHQFRDGKEKGDTHPEADWRH